jgi:cell filamentation protein
MSEYKYVDRDFLYTCENGMLKNKAGISNAEKLSDFESIMVAKRLQDLELRPIKIKFAVDLLKIHEYLFKDVYDWAGKVRQVEISKGGRQFLPVHSFNNAFAYLDSLLAKYFSLTDKKQIALMLAQILDNINFLHPFREGNGRAQREFIRCLALQKGYGLNLNPSDSVDIFERYMNGTINGDIKTLEKLIFELLRSKK